MSLTAAKAAPLTRDQVIAAMAERFWQHEGTITPWSALDNRSKERMKERAANCLAWLEEQGLIQQIMQEAAG